MGLIRRPSTKIFFMEAAHGGDDQQQVSGAPPEKAPNVQKPDQVQLPDVYATMLDPKTGDNADVKEDIKLYNGPFAIKPSDDSIKFDSDNFNSEWHRGSDGSVHITMSADLDPDNLVRTVKLTEDLLCKSINFDEHIYRTDEGVHVTSVQMQTDNAAYHPSVNGSQAADEAKKRLKDEEDKDKPDQATDKKPNADNEKPNAEQLVVTPDTNMLVREEMQFDKKGLMTKRTVQRSINGGKESLNSNADLHETYQDGYLKTTVFHSSVLSTDSGISTSVTVDKDEHFDRRGLKLSHRTIEDRSNDKENEFATHSTQEITRNEKDNTYTVTKFSQTRQKNGNIFFETNTTSISRDSAGEDIINGHGTQTIGDGAPQVIDYDPKQKKWISSDEPKAGNGPVASGGQPAIGSTTTASIATKPPPRTDLMTPG